MSATQQQSDQLKAALTTDPATMIKACDMSGKFRIAFFTFTQSGLGDAGSLIEAVKLPAGNARVILPLCRIYSAAMGTAATMDVGWLGYTGRDGSAVVADPNGLADGLDVAAAGVDTPTGTIGTHETVLFQSRTGVTLTLQVNDHTIADGKTVSGYFVYTTD